MSFNDVEEKNCKEKNLENGIRSSLSQVKMPLRKQMHMTWALQLHCADETPVQCYGLQMLPVESLAAPSETGVHIWFYVVSLLLLLILLEIQTSVLAQGQEILHRPSPAHELVC